MKFAKQLSLVSGAVAVLALSLNSSFVATNTQKVVFEVRFLGQWVSTELREVNLDAAPTLLGVVKWNDVPIIQFSESSTAESATDSGTESASTSPVDSGAATWGETSDSGDSGNSSLHPVALSSIVTSLIVILSFLAFGMK